MVSLHRKHGSRGLEIVAFPCNQFGGQEPGSAEDIVECTATREVAFTVMAKIDVNGPAAAPIYKFLKKASNTGDPRWNFDVYFIVSKHGDVSAFNVSPIQLDNIIGEALEDPDL